jgi:hypothetical protein
MSNRSKFPRVAARTRPKPRNGIVKLPTLKIGIYHGGELMSAVDIPDPRVAFCKEYNTRTYSAGRGYYALPITDAVKPTRRSGRKAVAQ